MSKFEHSGETTVFIGPGFEPDVPTTTTTTATETDGPRLASGMCAPREQQGGSGTSWKLFPSTGGYSLVFTSWPDDGDLANVLNELWDRRFVIHRLEIALHESLPTSQHVNELINTLAAVWGSGLPIGVYHRNKLIRRMGGYFKYDPLRQRRGGYVSNIY